MTQRTFGPDEPIPSSRQPGRSFENHRRPLGEELIEAAMRSGSDTTVAERAKAVAVLRKADEFMATENPPPEDAWGIRRALELAAGRCGVKFDEFEAIMRRDPELQALERRIFEDDVRRYGHPDETVAERDTLVTGEIPPSRH